MRYFGEVRAELKKATWPWDPKEKGFKKTFVLATSFNNRPTTTTAEFALDSKNKVLYGLHEKGTAKVIHIQHNPYVSLNWHREFDDNFANILCIQVLGKAELLEGTTKEFEEGLSVYPYQYGAAARKLTVEQWKAIIKKEMIRRCCSYKFWLFGPESRPRKWFLMHEYEYRSQTYYF